MINTAFVEALDRCSTAAGDGPGWNRRYRDALAKEKHIAMMIGTPGGIAFENWVTAPPPLENDPDGWPKHTVLAWLKAEEAA